MKKSLLPLILTLSQLAHGTSEPVKVLHFKQPLTIDTSSLQGDRKEVHLVWHYLIALPRKGELLLSRGQLVDSYEAIRNLKNLDSCQIDVSGIPLPRSITLSGDYPVRQINYENRVGKGESDYFSSHLELVVNSHAHSPGSLLKIEINRVGSPLGFPNTIAIETCFGSSAVLQ